MLALDLGVFQRKAHVISMREALGWFGVWTGLALIFNIGVILFHDRGSEAGLEFFTGFIVEKALSVDNIFVFILIFGYFKVPQVFQHKVLFWGIVGAIALRICFILGGLALLERFHWMVYVFGSFLLITGISMMRRKESHTDPGKSWGVRLFRKFLPVSDQYDGNRFFTRVNGKLMATPLFLVLIAVESSDIIFAVDSIPAIFAITEDPFIVYTSNIFAMLGLRALYFAVAGFMKMFHFLHYGFASIILILGTKMLLSDVYKVPVALSLVLIMVILLVCVIVSLMRPRQGDLKMMFERPERLGLLPFRRLLLIENIVDMGEVTVRDAMRFRSSVRSLCLEHTWEENLKLIRESRYSRYPVAQAVGDRPFGVLHVKDFIMVAPGESMGPEVMKERARPYVELKESMPLEDALARFQRGNAHLGVVMDDKNSWTGIITLEDVLEELVGKIGDEFDSERTGRSVSLAEGFVPERVVLGVEGLNLTDAIQHIMHHLPAEALPADRDAILEALMKREEVMSTYLGRGLAIPHARMKGLEAPVLFFGRSSEGVPVEGSMERVEILFILLTPDNLARHQPRLLADIVGVIDSDYVVERFKTAEKPEEIVEAFLAGQQVVLD
ncbi:tellurite resistance protein TerC [Roseimicrobium gellanilyticum]|uniref:Tellurite resistance protein TerC n=2 Tax=Roseimicrobium gellanilyticum TaxID=748857 RepID=A0A366HUG6_9BACT|nr:tellurite resistance protein TerC [Roseimicrobium gellanilyticum]